MPPWICPFCFAPLPNTQITCDHRIPTGYRAIGGFEKREPATSDTRIRFDPRSGRVFPHKNSETKSNG